MSLSVLVIGSGLSAVGAIKALRARGIRPTVIDRGEKLDSDRSDWVSAMAKKTPDQWDAAERYKLSSNPTVTDSSAIPKKMLFGSDFFYGKSTHDAPVHCEGNFPPFSYALGGLSAGWGAAVLPPQACDVADWPVSHDVLNEYCAKVLEELPYSARDDGLSLDFPILSHRLNALNPSQSDLSLLDALKKSVAIKKGQLVFGQARLLVASEEDEHSCKYCGQCMSGCVYGSIYKAGNDIIKMSERGEIDYVSGHIVERIAEKNGQVKVTSRDHSGSVHHQKFDRVFIASGAANSARIVLRSLDLYQRKVQMLSRGGFVIPMLSFKRLPSNWPNCNTQPGLFLEFRGKWLKHWVHVQISPQNELLLQKFSVKETDNQFIAKLKRALVARTVLLLVNYHSDHSGSYELWLASPEKNNDATSLHSIHKQSLPQWRIWFSSWFKLFSIFRRVGCIPLFPFAKLNSGAYHVGGTLPMKEQPKGNLETGTLGRVAAMKRVHVVDTATFPSLPGTTIGLLTMANAYRIVDQINWNLTSEND